MKTHTNEYKNNIKLLGREIDSKITYTLDGEDIELGNEDLNSVSPHYEGGILKSVMKQLDIDSNVDIPIGTEVNYQFGQKVGNSYEYLDFGNYIIYSSEKQEDTRSWEIVAYDKMLYAMKDYEAIKNKNLIKKEDYLQGTFSPSTGGNNDVSSTTTTKVSTKLIDIGNQKENLVYTGKYFELISFYTDDLTYISYTQNNPCEVPSNARYCRIRLNNNSQEILVSTIKELDTQLEEGTQATRYNKYFEYPTTIRDYIEAIANNLGLDFANKDDTFANYDREIDVDKFLDANGSSLGYTYRDVLDQLAEATASTICINKDDQLEVRYTTNTGEYSSASGTDIHIDNVDDIKDLDITLVGNTYQETTQGLNYFNAYAITNTNIVVSNDGATIKMPIATSGNGVTNTDRALKHLCPTLKVGDVVYLKATTTSRYNKYIYLGTPSSFLWNFDSSRTITQNDLDSSAYLYGNRYDNNETSQVTISDLRIIKNTNDNFEKFSYGASPNPDYPQEVQVVTGKQEILVQGFNIFDEVIENGYINYQTGVNVAGDNYRRSKNFIPVQPNTTYYLNLGDVQAGAWIGKIEYDKDKNYIGFEAWTKETTKTTGSNTHYIRFYLNANYYDKICINKNNTSLNGKYETYKDKSYEIKLASDNLFETFANGSITGLTEATTSIATIKQAFNYTRTLTFNNGEITGYPAVGNGSYYIWKLTFNLKPNTRYTLSCDFEFNNMTGASVSGNIWVFNNPFNANNLTTLSEHISAWGFTTNANGEYTPSQFINVDPRAYQETTTMRIYNIMLVEGQYTSSTMPTYEQYFNPIWLGGINDYKDLIYRTDKRNLLSQNFILGSINQYGNNDDNTTTRARSGYEEVKENTTYRFGSSNSKIYFVPYFYDNSKTFISYDSGWKNQSTLITTPANTKYIRILVKNNDTDTITLSEITNPMLNKGTIALPYEPYNSKDEWYINKATGKSNMGDLTWLYGGGRLYTNDLKGIINGNKGGNIIPDNILCNVYSKITPAVWYAKTTLGISVGGNGYGDPGSVLVYDSNYTTGASFKTAMSGNYIYYGLATPTYEKITNENLISQLESIRLLTGENNISITSDNLSSPITIKYLSNRDTIDEEYLKDINVNFGEKYGPVNSIVLSRSAGADNIYVRDEASIEENGLCEIKIEDNQLMNDNNRSDYLNDIFKELEGFEYYINDYSSTGITYYDLCDKYNVEIEDNKYPCVMLNDELNVTQGIEELVHTDMPEETQTDYTKSDKTDRRINQAYSIVDKQNQTITNFVSQTTQTQQLNDQRLLQLETTTNSVRQTLDNQQATIEVMEQRIVEGQETLRNNMVTININGINVSTNDSKIATLMTNEKFVIRSGDTYLAYFGYDSETGQTKAEMDNLTVTNYFTAGYHRVEKITIDGEHRTGWFYVDED